MPNNPCTYLVNRVDEDDLWHRSWYKNVSTPGYLSDSAFISLQAVIPCLKLRSEELEARP